jgi:arginine/lysine/ornithine decarboxylase
MNQTQYPLYEALLQHTQKKPISFHVPGHKSGQVFQTEAASIFQPLLSIDLTELTGMDDLHSPDGPILEAEKLLADLYQVKESFFLVNGSTAGNLAMIMAACEEDQIVLVQRNCHKSVLHAIQLSKAKPIFLEPEYETDWRIAASVHYDTVKEALQLYPEAKALILTYPNYYGIAYDIKPMIELAHRQDIPVLVDEAHGAHFIIGEPFPPSSAAFGADIIVQSAH